MKAVRLWKYRKEEEGGEKESRKYLPVPILVTFIPLKTLATGLLRGWLCQWWYSVMFLTSFMVKDFCSFYCGVKTKEIFTTLFIHIFNCVESTCLLRLNSVPSLQKQVYARLTPRTREKEKSFSIWACKMPKSLAVHQARIQSLCWYFWLVYLLWWLCLCKCSKTAILPTKTLNQTNILDARLAFPSLGCRMTSCLALNVCLYCKHGNGSCADSDVQTTL